MPLTEEQQKLLTIVAEQVRELQEWRKEFLQSLLVRLDRLEEKVNAALAGRPTWSVSIILATLSSVCAGLLVYAITHH